MAAVDFCPSCKPNTKKKCASCPRGRVDWVAVYEKQGGVERRPLPSPSEIRYLDAWYIRTEQDEEEHF